MFPWSDQAGKAGLIQQFLFVYLLLLLLLYISEFAVAHSKSPSRSRDIICIETVSKRKRALTELQVLAKNYVRQAMFLDASNMFGFCFLFLKMNQMTALALLQYFTF